MGLALMWSASAGWAQATLPVPTAPLTVCVNQPLPPATSYQLVFDGGAPEAVTVTAADAAKCKTTDTGSFTVAAARWTVGQHTLRLNAVNAGGSTQGPVFTITIQAPKPGEPAITAVVAGVTPPTGQALATYGVTTGSATFGLALPQGASPTGVRLGALATQTDVKTRWADGSIRFAIVSAHVPATGQYVVAAGSSASGTLTPTWPSASVTFTIADVTWVATLPSFTAAETWLDGPVVREARALVAPRRDGADHPLLQVIYDVRSYASGGHRVDITVQNTKDIPAADRVTYDVAISIGGQSVFSRQNVAHSLFQRWRRTFTTGGLVASTVTPDFEPFHRAKALPRFLPTVQNKVYDTTGPDYDILKFGTMAPYMMTPGGRAEIGPYPFWVAQYIVHKHPSQLEVMLRHGEYAGSWPLSVTRADGSLPKLGDNVSQQYWLDGRGGSGGVNGPAVPRDFTGGLRGYPPDPNRPDNQHLPALCYVPYLITGDRFFIDQLEYVANWAMLFSYPGDSKGLNGTLSFDRQRVGVGHGLLTVNGGRGFAWPLRELADVAAYLPDADPDKPYFVARLTDNLKWFDYYQANRLPHPLNFLLWDRGNGNLGPGYWFDMSLWQQAYLAWAIDHAIDQGFSTSGAVWFRDQAIKNQVLFLSSEADGYPPVYGAPYYPRVATRQPGGANAAINYFDTMAEVFFYNHGDGAGYPPNDTQPGHRLPQPMVGYYGVEARLSLVLGVKNGVPKAREALDWLTAFGGAADVHARSGFAIAEER
jgi:hypothetical protein